MTFWVVILVLICGFIAGCAAFVAAYVWGWWKDYRKNNQ